MRVLVKGIAAVGLFLYIGLGMSRAQSIYSPILVAPAQGDTLNVPNPTFQWSFVGESPSELVLEVQPIPTGIVYSQAFELGVPLYSVQVGSEGFWDYPTTYPSLLPGVYAWRLKWNVTSGAGDLSSLQPVYSDASLFYVRESTQPCYVKLHKKDSPAFRAFSNSLVVMEDSLLTSPAYMRILTPDGSLLKDSVRLTKLRRFLYQIDLSRINGLETKTQYKPGVYRAEVYDPFKKRYFRFSCVY